MNKSRRKNKPNTRSFGTIVSRNISQVPQGPQVPQYQQQESLMRTFGKTVADGLAWGTGVSIASRMVDKLFGPTQISVVNSNSNGKDTCENTIQLYKELLSQGGKDISEQLIQQYNQCTQKE